MSCDGVTALRTRGARSNCASTSRLISWGVSPMRQVPPPSASAWLFDLGSLRGPWILVLRDLEDEALERLAEHLVDLGHAAGVAEALAALASVEAYHAGVIW